MNTKQLSTWHFWTWRFRTEVEDNFPTPPRDDSLAFAYTEVAEALDAQLRQNTRYKRNNDKAHSIERELTQCAMMLLTAVPATWSGWQSLDPYPFLSMWTVRNIAIRVGQCMQVPSDYAYILGTVAAISTIVDLDKTLMAELDRMRAKHKSDGHGGALRDVYPVKAERQELSEEHNIYITFHGKPNYQTQTYRFPDRELTPTDYTEGANL